MEDYVYIIDHLPEGRADLPHHRREPVAYGVGEERFTLLELIPRPGVNLLVGDRVYIGKETTLRDRVEKVKGRVNFEDLSSSAHGELPYVLLDIVKKNEERFVRFFNDAQAISTRYHSLELLPGLGKKTVEAVVAERRKEKFKDFADVAERGKVHHPEKLIAKRIELELTDATERYHIFARPPMTEETHGGPPGRGAGPRPGGPRGAPRGR
jgi:putative nucleotide binding protein